MKKNEFISLNSHKTNLTGFTLIEVLVAISIFIVLITIFSGFFVNAIQAQRKALASQKLIDNISYNLEYMSRSIRMAKKNVNETCIGIGVNYEVIPNTSIEFIKFDHETGKDICQKFYLENKRLYQKKGNQGPLPLTPEDLKVNYFKPSVSGEQPKVIIELKIEDIEFRTAISQRNLNF